MYKPKTKLSSNLSEIIGIGALILLLLFLTYSVVSMNSSLPTVKKSNYTQECVEALSVDSKYTCTSMPEKYSLIWVEWEEPRNEST